MNILLYIIPGIIIEQIISFFNSTIPTEKDRTDRIIKLLALSIGVYFYSLVFLFIRFRFFNTKSELLNFFINMDLINYILNEKLWITCLFIILPSTFTCISYYIINYLNNRKDKTISGSQAFINGFLKINHYNTGENEEETSYPVIVYHDNEIVAKGRIYIIYYKPWEFKEILIENEEIDLKRQKV